jgi:hypothetical protein
LARHVGGLDLDWVGYHSDEGEWLVDIDKAKRLDVRDRAAVTNPEIWLGVAENLREVVSDSVITGVLYILPTDASVVRAQLARRKEDPNSHPGEGDTKLKNASSQVRFHTQLAADLAYIKPLITLYVSRPFTIVERYEEVKEILHFLD